MVAGYRQRNSAPHKSAFTPRATSPLHTTCNYCGEKHDHGKASCPARNHFCKSCGKKGHRSKVCWSSKKQEKAVNSVTVGGTTLLPEPLLQVSMASQLGGVELAVTALADTGAQVCVAGPALMLSLVSGLRSYSVGLAYETWPEYRSPVWVRLHVASASAAALQCRTCIS